MFAQVVLLALGSSHVANQCPVNGLTVVAGKPVLGVGQLCRRVVMPELVEQLLRLALQMFKVRTVGNSRDISRPIGPMSA